MFNNLRFLASLLGLSASPMSRLPDGPRVPRDLGLFMSETGWVPRSKNRSAAGANMRNIRAARKARNIRRHRAR